MSSVLQEEAGNHSKDASVGPYWFVRDDTGQVLLMAHRCSLAEAEEYGEFLTCPHGHYDVWEGWRATCPSENIVGVLRYAEYEEWPRGRVVFNAVQGQFIVYADRQISKSELQRVVERLGIPRDRVVFMRDDITKARGRCIRHPAAMGCDAACPVRAAERSPAEETTVSAKFHSQERY